MKHFVMLAVVLIASGGTVNAQSSEAIQAALNSDMGSWNFSTTKTVDVGGYNLRFRLDNNLGLAEWYYTSSSNSLPEEVTIPVSITVDDKEYIVVSTYGYASYEQNDTKKINLPETLRRIGYYTFYPFKNVKVLTIPEHVEVISDKPFYNWNNKTLHFTSVTPPTVNGPLSGSPSNDHMKLYVPAAGFRDYVKADGIKDQCVISDDWNNTESYSTVHTGTCANGELGYIVVADILPDVRTYAEINKLVIDKGTIDETDWYAIRQMPNLISLDISGLSIEEIPAGALKNCWQLEAVLLPNSVKSIKGEAFQRTGIHAMYLPDGLEEISGGYNFYDCDSLTSILIPDGVKSLPANCFSYCDNLHYATLPAYLETMGSACFYECGLYQIELPGTLQGVSTECFKYNFSMTDVAFNDGIGYVSYEAFQGNYQIYSLSLPGSIKTIYDRAFSGCSGIIRLTLGEGIEDIRREAFANCTSLANVTLPSSLLYCLEHPFYGCSGLKEISCRSLLPPTVRNQVITYNAGDIKLYVPLWSFQEYMTTPGWLEFQANLSIDETIQPENIYINKEFEFVLGEDQNIKDYHPNIHMFYNEEQIDDGFGHEKYERGNLTISSRSKLSVNEFSMNFSPYAKFFADYDRFNSGVDYDSWRTKYNPNSLIVKGEMRAEDQTINLLLRNDTWQFICFPFDVQMKDIVPENSLTQWVVRYYDGAERAAQHFDNTWKNLTSEDMLEAGMGYIMKCYLNNPQDNLVRFTVKPTELTLTSQWLFWKDDCGKKLADYPTENPELTCDRSWNLIGNPYPSYYDTRYMDTEAPFLVWDSYNGKYAAFSPVDDNYILNPGEAFFMQRPTDGDGEITFRKGGCQTHRNPNDLTVNEVKEFSFGTKATRTVLNITLTGEETTDRTRVVFNDKAEMGYEVSRDAALFAAMSADASQIWSEASGVKYAINERPMGDGIVELGLTCGKTGTYTIALGKNSGAESVILVDRQTGKKTTISTEQGYTFDAQAGTIAGRFYLSGDEVDGIHSIENGKLTIDNEGATYDLSGRRVNANEKGIVIKNNVKMLNK
ncbi:MAG: leucine-rich repeat domain-containing protein [Bacteroidaceae bacterium]|nr:leucine-rich repeat domain-containing protein [Bacteroidaceae bacterium]